MAEKDNQDKHLKANADKDFGLPKVEIKPLQQVEPKPDIKKSTPVAAAPEVGKTEAPVASVPPLVKTRRRRKIVDPPVAKKEKSKSKFWIWLILVLLFLGLGGLWYWYAEYYEQHVDPVMTTEIEEPAIIEEPEDLAAIEEPEIAEVAPETFTLTHIESRAAAPRYFVVVGSFIDKDMALDYSAKLNRQNKNTYLVYPYGDVIFYRLAIGEFENLARAVEELERVQNNFEENLWVLKY